MLRSRTYKFFLVFFFIFSLILSGCKTLEHINNEEGKEDTIIKKDTLINDSIIDTLTVELHHLDSIAKDSVTVKINDSIVIDTIVKTDSIVTGNKNTTPKKETKKESFIDDKIERSCNDSTV